MVARRSCELANPAQVRQIASQTGDLLRQMRFVAGRGAVAKRLVRGAAVAERHRENVASQGAVAETLTPNEVCCWQGSRLGDP